MKYPELKSEVRFIRQDVENKVLVEGIGEVQGIFLDARKMPMVRVKAGEDAYNIDLAAINYDEAFKVKYEALLAEIAEITKDGNDKVKAIVEEYNAMVDKKYEELLG